jgi:hypothetical protein
MSQRPPSRQQDQLTLAALLTAVRCAQLFVRYDLRDWKIRHEHIETAERLVSELTMNAVQTTGITSRQPTYSQTRSGLNPITVRLLLFDQTVVIQVWDTSPEPPADAKSGPSVLESVGTRWRYYHPPPGGKVVWCEVETS